MSGRTARVQHEFSAERFGLGRDVPHATGTMTLDGASFAPAQPVEAIRAGVGFVSEDRKADGVMPHRSVRENITLAALTRLTPPRVASRRRRAAAVGGPGGPTGPRATGARRRRGRGDRVTSHRRADNERKDGCDDHDDQQPAVHIITCARRRESPAKAGLSRRTVSVPRAACP